MCRRRRAGTRKTDVQKEGLVLLARPEAGSGLEWHVA